MNPQSHRIVSITFYDVMKPGDIIFSSENGTHGLSVYPKLINAPQWTSTSTATIGATAATTPATTARQKTQRILIGCDIRAGQLNEYFKWWAFKQNSCDILPLHCSICLAGVITYSSIAHRAPHPCQMAFGFEVAIYLFMHNTMFVEREQYTSRCVGVF